MLDQPTQETIRRALPEIYWVAIDHPDDQVNETAFSPQVRWNHQGFEPPEPPYESVTLYLDPTGVIQDDQSIDRERDRVVFDDAEVEEGHAHGMVEKGYDVYDVLNITVTARGNATISGKQFTPGARASALANSIQGFLIEQWPTRPLDYFDSNGAPINSDDPSVPELFADEIDPPIDVRPIPGRGPVDVTEKVDAAGAQYDTAVELGYADTWTDYEYFVRDAGVSAEPTQDPDAYDTR